MSVDDAIDKLINKRKPSTNFQKSMATNIIRIGRNKANVVSTRGGKKKKVGKKTRKKKNIKKTRK